MNCTTLLSNETLYKLQLIDFLNHRFSGSELEKETTIGTKDGYQIISLRPSFIPGTEHAEGTERIITIKNQAESRIETHRISTVRELADILNKEFGVSVLCGEEKV